MTQYFLEEKLEWRRWVTPGPLEEKPIHRWYVFPHSFSSELVHELIDEWGLNKHDHVLDPFVGAGTTILAAKEKGVPAMGYDLSPLAVLAARAKLSNYNTAHLQKVIVCLTRQLIPSRWNGHERVYSELVERALPGRRLGAFEDIARRIRRINCSNAERELLLLALLSVIPEFSRLVATGGWLEWNNKRPRIEFLKSVMKTKFEEMIQDLEERGLNQSDRWHASLGDARRLPEKRGTFSAVITSPPYPNRHDYTRVFGVELMFGFLNWAQTRRLRYQSFHSHPEARPVRPSTEEYEPPNSLKRLVRQITRLGVDRRVSHMIEGYFLDMYLCLLEMKRVCRTGAKIALIVGNTQYEGLSVMVDELTARIGEQAGLTCRKLIVARYRGNSAQQMAIYGRRPARESVVIFDCP